MFWLPALAALLLLRLHEAQSPRFRRFRPAAGSIGRVIKILVPPLLLLAAPARSLAGRRAGAEPRVEADLQMRAHCN